MVVAFVAVKLRFDACIIELFKEQFRHAVGYGGVCGAVMQLNWAGKVWQITVGGERSPELGEFLGVAELVQQVKAPLPAAGNGWCGVDAEVGPVE